MVDVTTVVSAEVTVSVLGIVEEIIEVTTVVSVSVKVSDMVDNSTVV